MISFQDLKQYKKVLLLFLFILFLSSLIAPIIKGSFDSLIPHSPFIKDLLRYKQGSYDFGKVVRRIVLVMAILIIYLYRKPLMINSLATVGIRHTQRWLEHLQMGFFLSTGIFVLYTAFLFVNGTKTLQIDVKSIGDLISHLFKFLLLAFIVSLIEEVFFRGFIFQSFLRDMRVVPAICASSLFYSLLHFFKVKIPVDPGFQPFIGFVVTYKSFANIFVKFTHIVPEMTGLFLVGVVLSYACMRTNSLYFSIGLHAGWIFIIKANSLFFEQARTATQWLFGDDNTVSGMLGWILLIATLFLVRLVIKASPGETTSFNKVILHQNNPPFSHYSQGGAKETKRC